ncbi:MAG: hypothetical protein ABGZ53_32925 [Fuerstiella sp.]
MSKPRVPLATHDFASGEVDAVFEFLKRMRSEMRILQKVRAWKDRFEIFDINGDTFEVRGIGYPDNDVKALLDKVNANYKPETIHDVIDADFKEFKTGRRYAWAGDRVM